LAKGGKVTRQAKSQSDRTKQCGNEFALASPRETSATLPLSHSTKIFDKCVCRYAFILHKCVCNDMIILEKCGDAYETALDG